MASDPTPEGAPLSSVQRFTDRVADYVRSRPGYPAEIVDIAMREFALQPGARLADVGSGTGKLCVEFLQRGFEVFGVEPNEAMRQAAATELAAWKSFHNVAGAAEALPLEDASVHLVTAGQAFHWFDQEKAKAEFRRVLARGGGVLIVWNNRRTTSSAFLQAYEDMLCEQCPDYGNIGNKHYDDAEIERFFAGTVTRHRLQYEQRFDLPALEARLFSSSYTPVAGPARQRLQATNRALFERFAVDGMVSLDYDTEVFTGHM